MHRFHPEREQETKTKSAFVITSKGCVARCTFCHRFEKGYRVMPVQKIIDYMLFLEKNMELISFMLVMKILAHIKILPKT